MEDVGGMFDIMDLNLGLGSVMRERGKVYIVPGWDNVFDDR
jgi:hypothetical protein